MKQFLYIVFSLFILSCNSEQNQTTHNNNPTMEFHQFLQDYYEQYLQFDPITATYSGDNRYNDKFPNVISKSYLHDQKAFYQDILSKLDSLDRSTLNDNDQTSYDILQWDCEVALEGLAFPFELTPIDQMWSVNLIMGQFASGASTQPFETVKDYDDWLKRVDGYLAWCDTAIGNMRKGIEQGVVLPKSLIPKVIPQFAELASGNVEEHLFYTPAKNIPDNIPADEVDRIKAQYKLMVQEKIMPAYGKIASFLEKEYLPKGRASSGVGTYDFGKELYQHMIKLYTSTNMTADEIHNLGLKEVARLRSEMEKVKTQVGFEGDLNAFFNHVRTNPALMPFTDPQQVIDNFNSIHERMIPQLDELFDMTPKAAFEVRRTEAFREASSSAEYSPASLDGSRPGIFYVPIPDVKKYNMYSDEDLFLHEAIPGHHYQVSLQQENEELPAFRKTLWYSAYGEGWALYSESLGKELGLYDDPYQYFGMLGAEMHRAIRLVVDTGIHAKGWSREDAIQYSLDNEAESEASIISEIERYMAMPGQALSYKIGQLKILELRARAEDKLGDRFDIKEFHNIMLKYGCVPLSLLEAKVDGWIASM